MRKRTPPFVKPSNNFIKAVYWSQGTATEGNFENEPIIRLSQGRKVRGVVEFCTLRASRVAEFPASDILYVVSLPPSRAPSLYAETV